MADNKYCSTCFNTGEELDEALTKALQCNDNAEKAALAALDAEQSKENAALLAQRAEAAAKQADKAPEIVSNASGETISVNDSAERPLRGLNIYGKTTQGGTPTMETPVELNIAGAAGSVAVSIAGEDGQTQTLAVSTPDGLRGVRVQSGGNYTDENGQQWICDEIDFARGVYVKRVKSVAFDGTEEFSKSGTKQFAFNVADAVSTHATTVDAFCSHFTYSSDSWGSDVTGFVKHNYYVYLHYMELTEDSVSAFKAYLAEQYANGNPVTVYYVLATPIETPLPAEELAQYATLHSNKPNTTVFNDAGAGLAVEYVADTKNYIDQKLAAISAAMLNA